MTDTVELSHTERMANIGLSIHLQALGDVTVRELSFDKIIDLSSDIVVSLNVFAESFSDSDKSGSSGLDQLGILLKNSQTKRILYKLLSAMTNIEVDVFPELGSSDTFKLLVAAKKVLDWEELKKLFLEMFPQMRMISTETSEEENLTN